MATVVQVAWKQQSSSPPGPCWVWGGRAHLGPAEGPSSPPHIPPTQGQGTPNEGRRGHRKCQAALSGKDGELNIVVVGQVS